LPQKIEGSDEMFSRIFFGSKLLFFVASPVVSLTSAFRTLPSKE